MTDDDKYLWDRGEEPDPDIVELEKVLSPLRMRDERPDFAALRHASFVGRIKSGLRPDWGTALTLAISITFPVVLVFFIKPKPTVQPPVASASTWDAQATSGVAHIGGKSLQKGQLAPGQSLTTGDQSSVHLRAGDIGEVVVGSNSFVTLSEATQYQ